MANNLNDHLSVVVDPQVLSDIRQSLENIQRSLPFLLELTPEELISLPKIDVANHDFVREAINALQTQQIPLPPEISLAEIQKDLNLYDQLDAICVQLERLLKTVRHTATKAGSEAYTSSLFVYQIVQTYAMSGIRGFGAIHKRLKQRFVRNSPSDKNPAKAGKKDPNAAKTTPTNTSTNSDTTPTDS